MRYPVYCHHTYISLYHTSYSLYITFSYIIEQHQIYKLRNLKVLQLGGNKLEVAPAEIGMLGHLQVSLIVFLMIDIII